MRQYHRLGRSLILIIAAACALPISILSAAEMVFPPDVFRPHYFVDVTKAPYSVDNTGKDDVTEKLRQAIVDIYNEGQPAMRQKTLYFPNGTYRISDTLDTVAMQKNGKLGAVHRLLWIGQSRDGTILKLDDNLPTFQDPTKPKGMIKTESIGTNGNDAYNNCIWNMTLDVGAGNPGAAGIDYLANNNGSIYDVCIKAPEGSGAAGLLMTRAWPGPAFVKNLEVDGFDYGVHLARFEYSITFEHLVLHNQRKAGFLNDGNLASIRDLDSVNKVPALQNSGKGGLVVLIDSKLKGGAADTAAITNNAGVFLRNIETEGYGQSLTNTDTTAAAAPAAGKITEYSSGPVTTAKGFSSARTVSLGLEIRETPQFIDNDFKNWYSVGNKTQPTPNPPVDQANEIQAAIDEAVSQGKTTFYFLPGQYLISKPIEFYGCIRRVLGLGTVLRPKAGGAFMDPANRQPLIIVRDLTGDDIEFNQFTIWRPADPGVGGFVGIQQKTNKTLILRNFESMNPVYEGSDGVGDLYIEGGVGDQWYFDHPGQHIWARQLDPEGNPSPKVTNVGSKLWILGLKTERPGTIIDSSKGAETEVLGGLFYPVIKPTDDPMFRVEDSRFSASYVTVDNNVSPDCPHQLLEIRNGQQQMISKEDVPPRPSFGGATAALATLMVAAPGDASTPSTASSEPAPGNAK